MVRFSCFLTPVNHTKSKKIVLQSAATMNSIPQEEPQDRVIKASICLDNKPSNASAEQVTSSSSHDHCSKSDELTGNSCPDESEEFHKTTSLKKSKSLGSVLDKTRDYDDVTEDGEMGQEFSFDYFRTGHAEVDDHGGAGDNTPDKLTENEASEHVSIFSIGVMQHDDAAHSTDHMGDSVHSSTHDLPIFAKSRSAANLRVHADSSIESCMTHELSGHRSRSVQNLCSLHEESDEYSNDDNTHCYETAFQRHISASFSQDIPEPSDLDGKEFPCHAESREEGILFNTSGDFNEVVNQDTNDNYLDDNIERENQSVDEYKAHGDDNLPDSWTEPEIDGHEIRENLQHDSSIQNWDQQLTSEELNIKRIEDWISKIDIQNGTVVEELGEISSSVPKKDPHVVASVASTKNDANNLGMEVAYKYISSLPPSSSSAQMSNLGLVAVPFLGAFVSLRMLNLSGNNIVRITAGALPKGLHMLNLSKNNISTIEGLRDLTRLRVLDLSFNRITRIGHGLASCSSLKELYLASNKISEVEGLHRLLKLNVLDLRYNKISTTKGLGQLAANYGSLQAINLERNPAQINVGDEHLKKYLLSLLPNLVYYNKHTIRAGSSKDVTDRPPRSLTSHMRTEQTGSRRGSHSSGLYRSISSLSGRTTPAASSSLNQSKSRHVRLPPAGSKATNNYQPYGVTKQLSSRPSNPIRRSLSEGML